MNDNEIIKFPTHIILFCIIIITIYILYNDYIYERDNRCDFIEDHKHFENNLHRYEQSNIYNKYSNLSDSDKLFLNDYVNYIRNRFKNGKPTFNKKLKRIKNQVLFASIASFLFASSIGGFFKSLEKNSIQHFLIAGI